MGEWPHGHRERPREPKVSQLKLSVLSYENVLRFHIPMHNPITMACVNPKQYLTQVALYNLWRHPAGSWGRSQLPLLVHNSCKVAFAILKYEIDLVQLRDNGLQLHKIRVIVLTKFFQCWDLAEYLGGNALTSFFGIVGYLQCENFARLLIRSFVNFAICTSAEQEELLVCRKTI